MDFQDLISSRDLARILGVTDSTIRKMIQRGALPCNKIGRDYIFSKLELVEMGVLDGLEDEHGRLIYVGKPGFTR